ncbi:hypothetical protein [Clostridium mobile]|nr:hypothetical protein [Clostridium mobile]
MDYTVMRDKPPYHLLTYSVNKDVSGINERNISILKFLSDDYHP